MTIYNEDSVAFEDVQRSFKGRMARDCKDEATFNSYWGKYESSSIWWGSGRMCEVS